MCCFTAGLKCDSATCTLHRCKQDAESHEYSARCCRWVVMQKHLLTLSECDVAAAQNASDSSRMGAVHVPDGVWVEELSLSWRNHMNTQLSVLGSKSKFMMHSDGGTGHLMAPQLVPLDQGSVNGIVQNVNDEGVRQQVCKGAVNLHVSIAVPTCGAD